MVEVVQNDQTTRRYNVGFASAYKDRVLNTGRRSSFPTGLKS